MAYHLTIGNWNQILPEEKGNKALFTSKMAPQCRNWGIGDLLTADMFNCIVRAEENPKKKPIWKVIGAQWVRYDTDDNGKRHEILLSKRARNAVKKIEIEVL